MARREQIDEMTLSIGQQADVVRQLAEAETVLIEAKRAEAVAAAKLNAETEELVKNRLELAGKSVGALSEGFGRLSKALEETNPELAAVAEHGKQAADVLSSAFSGAAAGASLGPWGAVIGGITGGLAEVGLMYAETMAEISRLEEEAAANIEKTNQNIAKRHKELGAEDASKWIETLDDEAGAYERINSQMERSIGLLQAKRQAKLETEDAKAALEMAKIDADPKLSQEEKVRRRAEVEEASERRRANAEYDEKMEENAAAKKRYEAAGEEFRVKGGKVNQMEGALELADKLANSLSARGEENLSYQERRQRDDAKGRADEIRKELPAAIEARDEQRKRTDEIQKEEQVKGRIARMEAEEIRNRYPIERETRHIRTEGRAGEAAGRDRQEKEKREQEAKREEIERRSEKLNQSAMSDSKAFAAGAARLKSNGRLPALAGALGDISGKLEDGTDDKEIREVAKQFSQATDGMSNATLTALKQMLAAQQKQAAEIRKLQGELKKGGDGN